MTSRFTKTKFLWTLVAVGAAAYGGLTYHSVARQADTDETRPSEAIVVFGAAEY